MSRAGRRHCAVEVLRLERLGLARNHPNTWADCPGMTRLPSSRGLGHTCGVCVDCPTAPHLVAEKPARHDGQHSRHRPERNRRRDCHDNTKDLRLVRAWDDSGGWDGDLRDRFAGNGALELIFELPDAGVPAPDRLSELAIFGGAPYGFLAPTGSAPPHPRARMHLRGGSLGFRLALDSEVPRYSLSPNSSREIGCCLRIEQAALKNGSATLACIRQNSLHTGPKTGKSTGLNVRRRSTR